MSAVWPVTCRGCSLLCDDLEARQNPAGGWELATSCAHAQAWFQQGCCASGPEPAVQQSLLKQVREIVASAKNPLLLGLQGLTLEAETLALEWAEQLRAWVCLGSSVEKIRTDQLHGGTSCSLGEIRHRADVVLCGNLDVLHHWSRFEERFLTPAGRFRPAGVPRQRVFLGAADALKNAQAYDEVILLPTGTIPEALQILRRMFADQPPLRGAWQTSLPAEVLLRLQDLSVSLLQAEYPILLTEKATTQAALWNQLAIEINQKSRMHQLTLTPGSASGNPGETLLALTGFPDAVRFESERILHDLERFQPEVLLKQQPVDAVIYLGGLWTQRWQQVMNSVPDSVPVIAIIEHQVAGVDLPERAVIVRTGQAGLQAKGTLLRADGIPLPLHALPHSEQMSLEQALGYIVRS